MGVIYDSGFTESTLTALTAHTPDTAGDGATEEYNDSSSGLVWEIKASSSRADSTHSESNDALIASLQPNPSVAEYDIEAYMGSVEATGSEDWFGLLARYSDEDNHYGFALAGSDEAASIRLYIRSGGTTTELASADLDLNDDDVIKFEVRNAAKKGYVNQGAGYVEQVSSTNNAITGAGKACIALGDFMDWDNTGDIDGSWEIDRLVITEVEGGGGGGSARSFAQVGV